MMPNLFPRPIKNIQNGVLSGSTSYGTTKFDELMIKNTMTPEMRPKLVGQPQIIDDLVKNNHFDSTRNSVAKSIILRKGSKNIVL